MKRFLRVISAVVLTAFVGGFGLPLLAKSHGFNDDPHWAVALGTDASGTKVGSEGLRDGDHCEVCHWLRTLRSGSRPARLVLSNDVRQVVAPAVSDPRTSATSALVLGARAPPPSFR